MSKRASPLEEYLVAEWDGSTPYNAAVWVRAEEWLAVKTHVRQLEAALEAVEWVPRSDTHGEVDGEECPWCEGPKPYMRLGTDGGYYEVGGHAPDCPRQAAIKKVKGEA